MPETSDIALPEQPGLPDAAARARALDPAGSFIVQAPAGSGKTGLLTQRFLRLLATVDHPEEIVAITFTRKAAGEMRSRIAEALRRAQGAEPEAVHEQVTWRLARAALERDRERGWHLIDHPNRLRIQTFDAYCAALTRQMPVLAQFGAQPAISADAGALYRDAARRTLAALEGQGWSEAVARLLRHVDNDLGKVEALLVDQLDRREQWLPHLAAHRADPAGARAALEAALARTVSDGLARARAAVPLGTGRELMALARFAAGNLAAAGSDSPVTRLAAAGDELPGTDPADRPQWEALAELLLTREGGWRKTVNKTNGFPAAKDAPAGQGEDFKQSKAAMGELLETLAEHAPELAVRLHAVRELPAPAYGEDQWAVLAALTEVLPLAAAQLSVVFGESGEIDFTGVALAAREALGEPEAPTDLALALDYRIRHLLVDEFQDTSTLQMDLLQRLTAGWAPGDGRSLFLVGDPMQSIYRFRDAEVGLFLRAREQGLPGLPLTPLRLEANFRSRPAVVEWVNRAFPDVLAIEEDIARGAVPYAPATAVREAAGGAGVTVHPFLARDDTAEAERVVALLRDAGSGEGETSTAVLVRSRNHLAALIPRLREAGIPFEAVEIERLGHRPVIQDLLALTRALVHPADRPAWLAVLRAPWCG
ncbi:MAG TPA: UvrD-helicase domain-containing protein, partial [Gammaproteobacteria bacterium]|nr:UvrD-helicase domain-containing protein [Gammaproteobacteria bacterium]